ncbi:MAG: ATP-binding cassette domain-containing protein [Gloeomargaritaceae cyanobacterium C42_A2020_066]|nr:ATP-binding cassette domain-containing protein [Gloeomargaritaceae cyanobacterium C42_A2020_066]
MISKSFQKLYYLISDQKLDILKLQFLILFSSLLESVGIGITGSFIALAGVPDLIQRQKILAELYGYSQKYLLIEKTSYFVALIGIVIIIIYAIKLAVNLHTTWLTSLLILRNQIDLKAKLLSAYLDAPYGFHLEADRGKLVNNILRETDIFSGTILTELVNMFSNLAMLLFLSALLVISNAFNFLVMAGIFIITFGIILGMKKRLATWGKGLSVINADMIRLINQGLGGIKEIKIIGCEDQLKSRFGQQGAMYIKYSNSLGISALQPKLVIEMIAVTFIVGLTSLTLFTVGENNNLIATLSVFGLVSIRLIPALNRVSSGLTRLRGSWHTIHELYRDLQVSSVLEYQGLVKNLTGNKIKQNTEEKIEIFFGDLIEIANLSYRYPQMESDALANICLTIPKGSATAFIGRSGAGKTTLVDLILGLLTPTEGDIRVDGQISIYSHLNQWYKLIGYIPQSLFLMDDSLARNVAFGVADHQIDYKKLETVTEAAQLSDLVKNLPAGLETHIGEGGVRLSGGQRQRIGIARALYHDREILVLDEATSALDQETEQSVVEAIRQLGKTKTTITIAHRLETIRHSDVIHVLDQGRLIRSGSYEEVVLRSGFSPD